jgi:hypothetical protein
MGEIHRAEFVRILVHASEALGHPYEVIQGAVNHELTFCDRDFPSEENSMENPPISFTHRGDQIVIDGALGFYDSSTMTGLARTDLLIGTVFQALQRDRIPESELVHKRPTHNPGRKRPGARLPFRWFH